MENNILTTILYLLLFLIEGGMYASNYDNIQKHGQINIIIVNTFVAFISLNILFIFLVNVLKRNRKFKLIWYLTTINYIAFNTSIVAFEFMFMIGLNYFEQYHITLMVFLIQLILLPIWQILLTIMYFEQNDKLNSLINKYGKFGLIVVIIKIILIIFCIIINYEFGFITNIRAFFINAITLIYLIVIQLQYLFISFGSDKKQYKSLDYVILFYLVQYNFLNYSSQQSDIYSNKWLSLLIFILMIDFKRYPIVQEDILQQDFQQSLFCFFCKEYINKIDKAVYFQDSQNIFHNLCYVQYKSQAFFVSDYYFSIDFQQNSDKIKIKDSAIYIITFLTFILLNLIIILNNGNAIVNNFYKLILLCQFVLLILLIILEFAKKFKVVFFAKLKFYIIAILYICQYSNYIILYQIIQKGFCQKYIWNNYEYYECDFQEYVLIIFEVVLYYFYSNFLQGFLFSKLFFIPKRNIINQQNLIIFHSFFLICIQNIVYQILLVNLLWFMQIPYFQESTMKTIIILLNFTNPFLSLYIALIIKPYSLQVLFNKSKIVYKIYQYYTLFQIFAGLFSCFQFNLTSDYDDENWLIQRTYLLLQFYNAYYTLYIKWFCFKINDIFNKNQQQRISNYEELIIPEMYQIQTSMCKNCKRQIQNGQTIIYKTKCKHSMHKECQISWLNYPWCCQSQENQKINNYQDFVLLNIQIIEISSFTFSVVYSNFLYKQSIISELQKILLFINLFLIKMDDLLKRLEIRIEKQEKQNDYLLGRICELEDQQEHLNDQIKKLTQTTQEQEKRIKELENANPKQVEVEENWLFNIQKGRPVQSIKQALQIESEYAYELDSSKWMNEEVMWRNIIHTINKDGVKDLDHKQLAQLKQIGKTSLQNYLNLELILVIRNFSDFQIQYLVELCECVTHCWNELELDEDSEGRIIVTVETELNKIEHSTVDGHKVILQVEKLQ
ncbi:hypothetical protein pb186bvf_009858 [Paramecium bursaria]